LAAERARLFDVTTPEHVVIRGLDPFRIDGGSRSASGGTRSVL
jgi:hypothetical protein